jgi:alpha-1,3-rhamnosyl/mannosyltransferase
MRQPPLSHLVQHIGYVPHDERERLYAGARALVLPSFDEGFGLPVLEAMSAGLPVIVSNRGSLPEVVGTAGSIVPADDAAAWAAAIARTHDDQPWMLAQGAASLARAATFTWSGAASQLRQAYLDAVARRGSR